MTIPSLNRLLASLRIVRAARRRLNRSVLLAHGLDLRPHGFVSEGAERQPERRMVLFNRRNDRFGRAHGIARLISAVALDLAPPPDRCLRIGVDGLLWRLQRAAGPVGAEGAGFDDDDLVSEGRHFLRLRTWSQRNSRNRGNR